MSVVRASYAGYYPPAPSPWPTRSTTGYVHAPDYPGSLADGSALTIASNTTYSFYNFPAGVAVGADVNNVTFHGCQFLSGGGPGNMAVSVNNAVGSTIHNDNITFTYCTFAPIGVTEPGPVGGVAYTTAYQYGIFAGTIGQLTADHCDCWGFGNGFVYADGGTLAKPHTYQYNYVHDISQDAQWHSDGLGLPGGGASSGDVIHNNYINCQGNTNALAYQVVAQSGQGNSSWSNFTITGNLFGGYGYTIQLLNGNQVDGVSAPSNIIFTGNTFSTGLLCGSGPLYDNSFISKPAWVWRNNKWLVPAGNPYWGHVQYSGYYWLPGFTSNAGPSLDELAAGLVGTTDYTG
jgi:hypothetical protein